MNGDTIQVKTEVIHIQLSMLYHIRNNMSVNGNIMKI